MVRTKHESASLYIGATSRGIPQAVFWDCHTPIFNNRPPVTLITGGPGSGKTFLALTIATMSTLVGKTTVVLDPKGDFLSLGGLIDEFEEKNFTVWDLNNRNNTGILDPFYMSNNYQEKINLALNLIQIFCDGVSPNELTAISPHIQDMASNVNPSFLKLINNFRRSQDEYARNIGTKLELISNLPYASLCFKKDNIPRSNVSIDHGLTIVSMIGLELPKNGQPPKDQKERLGAGIMFIITDFLKNIMMETKNGVPKTIIIDEAHAVLSSDAGASSIHNIARLGRSLSTALVLVTQSSADFKAVDIKNTISTRFSFRTDKDDARRIIKDMDLPQDQDFEQIFTILENGECLMQDYNNNYSTVQITNFNQKWSEAFESNPLEKLKKQQSNNQQSNNISKI